jgi:putative endonuclease
MNLDKKELAKRGEDLAAKILSEKGYEIIERNYRFSHGEIDIIAIDPKDECTVFVEVKARQNLEYGEPEYAITKNKHKEIRELDCRFDVVAILFEDLNNPEVNHYENAF